MNIIIQIQIIQFKLIKNCRIVNSQLQNNHFLKFFFEYLTLLLDFLHLRSSSNQYIQINTKSQLSQNTIRERSQFSIDSYFKSITSLNFSPTDRHLPALRLKRDFCREKIFIIFHLLFQCSTDLHFMIRDHSFRGRKRQVYMCFKTDGSTNLFD